ncbi:PREDICTED: ribonuclease Y-like [Priapulus caudatus]|uniref:Ribonuclease Y-like n=1 Tax=Priapulus caudatus TaxID=37621 RepID=A0ABM1E9I0_PRICU|nr:PREDICTED: ribonuclease Y-like [Priapulus caudatus]
MTSGELEDRAVDDLKEFPVEGACTVLKQFRETNLEHVTNKSAYLCGMLNVRTRNCQKEDQVSQAKGPDEAKLKTVLEDKEQLLREEVERVRGEAERRHAQDQEEMRALRREMLEMTKQTNKKSHEARVTAEKKDEAIANLKSMLIRAEEAADKLTTQLASLRETHRREAETTAKTRLYNEFLQ